MVASALHAAASKALKRERSAGNSGKLDVGCWVNSGAEKVDKVVYREEWCRKYSRPDQKYAHVVAGTLCAAKSSWHVVASALHAVG